MPRSIASLANGLITPARRRVGGSSGLSAMNRIVVVTLMAASAMGDASSARATHPEHNCASHDRLTALLTGKPHYERRVLVLADKMPGQGGRFELFANNGEGGRHSYTLLRTRRGSPLTCIVTAGLVELSYVDDLKRTHLLLRDENDPDKFDIITHDKLYIITRKFEEQDIIDYLMYMFGFDELVVSYGDILDDQRVDAT